MNLLNRFQSFFFSSHKNKLARKVQEIIEKISNNKVDILDSQSKTLEKLITRGDNYRKERLQEINNSSPPTGVSQGTQLKTLFPKNKLLNLSIPINLNPKVENGKNEKNRSILIKPSKRNTGEITEDNNGNLVLEVIPTKAISRNPDTENQGAIQKEVFFQGLNPELLKINKQLRSNNIGSIIDSITGQETKNNSLEGLFQVDNVNWKDYTEVRFFLEPDYDNDSLDADLGIDIPSYLKNEYFSEEIKDLNHLNENRVDFSDYENFSKIAKEAISQGYLNGLTKNIKYFSRFSENKIKNIVLNGEDLIINQHKRKEPFNLENKSVNYTEGLVYYINSTFENKELVSSLYQGYLSNPNLFASMLQKGVSTKVHEGLKEVQKGGTNYQNIPAFILELLKNPIKTAILLNPEKFTFKSYDYWFNTFEPYSWNLGLRLVYRMEFRPLGMQPGEVVKTIPLGPKQVEKVSTKIIRRTKTKRTYEKTISSESTSETTETAKDSSELIQEMSESVDRSISAEASAGIGSFSASMSASYEDHSESSSSDTSSRLNENVQKVANKLRQETKVVVSMESESTYESTTSNEIYNPNDEIAVTYIYRKLQQQYQVFTQLAEVQNVIMIGEGLPFNNDDDSIDEWIKSNDSIIAKVLLDSSYVDALSSYRDELIDFTENTTKNDKNESVERFEHTLNQTIEALGKGNKNNVKNVDFIQESQKHYVQRLKEKEEIDRLKKVRDEKRKQFRGHVLKNILHYCRAVWNHEDPQQRMLRYRKRGIKIPVLWKAEINSANNRLSHYEGVQGSEIDIVDLINPAGPIGYYGNYAMFYLRSEFAIVNDKVVQNSTPNDTFEIATIFDILKQPYIYKENHSFHESVIDPLLKKYKNKFDDNYFSELVKEEGEELVSKIFSEQIEDMVRLIPKLRLKYLQWKKMVNDSSKGFKEFYDESGISFTEYYAEYKFRQERTREVILDTNNLMIELLSGEGSTLEPFKKAHRYFDAKKAEQEYIKMELENLRRLARLEEKNYEDPDIEKVIVAGDYKDGITKFKMGMETKNNK